MESKNNWIDELYDTYKDSWLKGKIFRKSVWIEGDHEHCLFDGKRISKSSFPDNEKQGYASTIGCVWICPDCFEAFVQKHKLPVKRNTIREIEAALEKHQTVVISLDNEQYFIQNAGSITVEHNGTATEYESITDMENRQLFYGKLLRENIDYIFVGYCDPA